MHCRTLASFALIFCVLVLKGSFAYATPVENYDRTFPNALTSNFQVSSEMLASSPRISSDTFVELCGTVFARRLIGEALRHNALRLSLPRALPVTLTPAANGSQFRATFPSSRTEGYTAIFPRNFQFVPAFDENGFINGLTCSFAGPSDAVATVWDWGSHEQFAATFVVRAQSSVPRGGL